MILKGIFLDLVCKPSSSEAERLTRAWPSHSTDSTESAGEPFPNAGARPHRPRGATQVVPGAWHGNGAGLQAAAPPRSLRTAATSAGSQPERSCSNSRTDAGTQGHRCARAGHPRPPPHGHLPADAFRPSHRLHTPHPAGHQRSASTLHRPDSKYNILGSVGVRSLSQQCSSTVRAQKQLPTTYKQAGPGVLQ